MAKSSITRAPKIIDALMFQTLNTRALKDDFYMLQEH